MGAVFETLFDAIAGGFINDFIEWISDRRKRRKKRRKQA